MTDPSVVARPLQALWGEVTAGGVTALLALTVLSLSKPAGPAAAQADNAFYACAVYGVVALALAFWLLRRMEVRIVRAPSDAAALAVARGHGVAALAAVESSAVMAGMVVFLTGNLLALAFGVPLVAFAALTWPSASRVGGWLALRR